MPNPIIKQFVVEGARAFPLEMLHADQCWPARAADAAVIANHQPCEGCAAPVRTVMLATAANHSPSRQRWRGFGWRVID